MKYLYRISVTVALIGIVGCDTFHVQPTEPTPTSTTIAVSPPATAPPDLITEVAPGDALQFPEASVSKGIILSGGGSADCQLPCWNGLRIGEATYTEVQEVFEGIFDAPDGFPFFPDWAWDTSRIHSDFRDSYRIDGMIVGGYYWWFEVPNIRSGWYSLVANLDPESGHLADIYEEMFTGEFYEVPTVQEVVSTLGPPTEIYFDRAGVYGVTLIYAEGINVYFGMPREYIELHRANVCFDAQPLIETIQLFDPEAHAQAVDENQPTEEVHYIDKPPDMTVEQFVELVYSNTPCIEVIGY